MSNEMFTNIIILSYIAHYVGDYFLQTNLIAYKKANSYFYTFIHSMLYFVPFLTLWLILKCSIITLWYVIILGLSHAIIDMVKCYCTISYNNFKFYISKVLLKGKYLFLIDQFLHYISIFIVSLCMKNQLMNSQMIFSFDIKWLVSILYLIIFLRPTYIAYKLIVTPENRIYGLFSWEQTRVSMMIVVISIAYGFNLILGVFVSIFVYLIHKAFSIDKNLIIKSLFFIACASCLYKGLIMLLLSI